MQPESNTLADEGGRIPAILMGMLPVFAILSLGGYMAGGQARARNALMQAVPEYERLADIAVESEATLMMISGRLASLDDPSPSDTSESLAGGAGEWLVYHEREQGSRVSREAVSESLVYPPLRLILPDGELRIEPVEAERMIHAEPHSEVVDGRLRSGFRAGDVVTVQGDWHAAAEGQPARLTEATGISGMRKAALVAETERAARTVTTFSRVTGLLALLGLAALIRSRVAMSAGRRAAVSPEAREA